MGSMMTENSLAVEIESLFALQSPPSRIQLGRVSSAIESTLSTMCGSGVSVDPMTVAFLEDTFTASGRLESQPILDTLSVAIYVHVSIYRNNGELSGIATFLPEIAGAPARTTRGDLWWAELSGDQSSWELRGWDVDETGEWTAYENGGD